MKYANTDLHRYTLTRGILSDRPSLQGRGDSITTRISLRPINISPYIPVPKLGETYHYAMQNVPGRKGLGRALKLEQCNEHETCAGKMLEAAPLPMMKKIMRWFFYYKSHRRSALYTPDGSFQRFLSRTLPVYVHAAP